jgi:hypothetical protein
MKKIAFFDSLFPKTIKKTPLNENDIVVDCENNFTEVEKKVIRKYNIHKIEELVTNTIVHRIDKIECLLYYKYILENYNLNGFEVFENFVSVQLDNYIFNIVILQDRSIKFCSSVGQI